MTLSPLNFPADHEVLDRSPQQVRQRVLALVERVRRLTVRVFDIDVRVTDAAGEFGVPVVIQEGDDAGERKSLALDRRRCVSRVLLDADVHRSVVHVVLNAGAKHVRQA